MKPEELMEKMDETHEVLILLGKRIDELAKKEAVPPEIQIPDYKQELEELKSLVTRALKQPAKSALEEIKIDMAKESKTLGSIGFLTRTLVERSEHLETLVKQLPKTVTQVEHHYHLDNKSKWLLAAGIVLLLITSIVSGLYYSLSRENRRLHDNDVKFRMIRQNLPIATRWIDSTFSLDPENEEKAVENKEAQALELAEAEAEAIAKQKLQEAKDAKSAVRKLKKQ